MNKLPHLFSQKKAKSAGSLLARSLIWSTIKSQAFAFEYGTLPFFVHRQSSPAVCTSGDASEPLANCRSIMSMYRQKTEACKKLVLQTLLLEIQRIYQQVRVFLPVETEEKLNDNSLTLVTTSP